MCSQSQACSAAGGQCSSSGNGSNSEILDATLCDRGCYCFGLATECEQTDECSLGSGFCIKEAAAVPSGHSISSQPDCRNGCKCVRPAASSSSKPPTSPGRKSCCPRKMNNGFTYQLHRWDSEIWIRMQTDIEHFSFSAYWKILSISLKTMAAKQVSSFLKPNSHRPQGVFTIEKETIQGTHTASKSKGTFFPLASQVRPFSS